MFCKFCGTKVEDTESTFCGNCGARLKENGFDEIIEDISEDISDDTSEGMPETSKPTPIEVEPTGDRTFKDKVMQMISNIGERIQRHKKWSIGIATGVICLCAIGVGIYFGYEDQPVVNNMVSSSLPVIKPKEHKEEKKNYDTIEIKADDTKDIQFLLNEQKEKDKQGFANEAQRVARLYLEAWGDNNHRESYTYLTAAKKEEVGGLDGWLKRYENFRSTVSNIQIGSAIIDGNKAVVHYIGIHHFNGFLGSYTNMIRGEVRLSRDGTTVGVDY